MVLGDIFTCPRVRENTDAIKTSLDNAGCYSMLSFMQRSDSFPLWCCKLSK
jgi:hypothetical protein